MTTRAVPRRWSTTSSPWWAAAARCSSGWMRAATTVVTEQGRRNVGSSRPRRNADRSANPVLTAVLAGQTHTGEATVADRPYFTAYEGLHSSTGGLVGMLYVGMPLDALPG